MICNVVRMNKFLFQIYIVVSRKKINEGYISLILKEIHSEIEMLL